MNFYHDKKLDAASRRRESFFRTRELRARKINERKNQKSKTVLHHRWIEENERQRRSFIAKRNDQDQVNLRKVLTDRLIYLLLFIYIYIFIYLYILYIYLFV